jgi:nitrite reductase/ring-hydroxylating ferredoxin subunit
MRRICVGQIEDIPEGEGKAVEVLGREYAVFRDGGKLYALENRCPHAGGPLADGFVGGGFVTCPLHGMKFDLQTGQAAGGGGDKARSISVTREEEFICLEVDLADRNLQNHACPCGR